MRLGASVLFFLSLSESRSESIHHAQLPDLTGLKTQVNAKVLADYRHTMSTQDTERVRDALHLIP